MRRASVRPSRPSCAVTVFTTVWLALWIVTGVVALSVGWRLAASQPTAPPVTCEAQVGVAYEQLVQDQLVLRPPTPLTAWSEQLSALLTELRVSKTQGELKAGQAQLSERNLAMVAERARILVQENARLQAEVAHLKERVAP
jgi:hypothetical protein